MPAIDERIIPRNLRAHRHQKVSQSLAFVPGIVSDGEGALTWPRSGVGFSVCLAETCRTCRAHALASCPPPLARTAACQIQALAERIERLSKDIEETSDLHQQEEAASRKKKAKLEAELALAVGRYDRDMKAKTAQIAEIKASRAGNTWVKDHGIIKI